MKWTEELRDKAVGSILAHREDERETFSMSSAGHCVRKLFYKEVGTEVDNPAGPELDMCGDLGTFMHDHIRKLLLMDPELKLSHAETILYLKLGEHTIKGHCDGIIHWGRKRIFVDIKTMSPYKFRLAAKGEHDPSYLTQMACYRQALLNVGVKPTNFVFWCVNRQTMEQNVVEVRLKDSEWDGMVEEVYHKLSEYHEGLHNWQILDRAFEDSIPRRPLAPDPKGRLDFECAVCPFRATCWEGEEIIQTSKWSAKLKQKEDE